MENGKKSNGTLVGVSIGLVIAIIVVGGLFATGTIGFKTTTTSDNGQASENYNQIDNVIGQKDPDNQIPINPPKVPHDKIPESIINSRKKLKLIIIQSKYLSEGREFLINAGGLVGSPRNAKDGITIFGDSGVIIIIIIIYIIFILE